MLTINVSQSEVQSHLLKIQSQFRTTLVTNVADFKLSVNSFTSDYAQVSLLLLVTVAIVAHAERTNGCWYSTS